MFIIKSIFFPKTFFIILLCLTCTIAYSQSVEQGNAFNKFMGVEEGVNPSSGAAAFKKTLMTISSGKASFDLEMTYSSNVEEVVKNKNGIALVGWIGLGWNFGHAKIVSDNSGTMWNGDDSYYLQTPAGVKFKIIKGNGENEWWVESLPYWILKQKTKSVEFKLSNGTKKTYLIVIGWELTSDTGIKYTYGDMEYDENYDGVNDEEKLKHYATEYTLANPYANGIVGVYEGGHDVLFPKSWNLQKIEDIDGNYLSFTYDQYTEKVYKEYMEYTETSGYYDFPFKELFIPYTTKGYTKECYLKSVESSQGGRIEFVTKRKDYQGEFIDNIGESEESELSEPDAYEDPLERRYLSQIIVYGRDDKIVRYIDFCYEALNVRVNGSYNPNYVKRLLTSVIETNAAGEEIQKELYSYVMKDYDEETKSPLPLGAIDSIKGPNCGVVKYVYDELPLADLDRYSGMHQDVLPLIKVSMGVLEDGTNYIVGVNKNINKVEVYFRRQGKWKLQQTLVDGEKGVFYVGDKNWFIYKDSDENGTYYPFVWNGKEWVQGKDWNEGKVFEDNGSHDIAYVGPGYLLTAHIHDNKIELKLHWSIWNSSEIEYEETITSVDDDDDDRKYIKFIASRNHFGIFYKDRKLVNSGHLKIYSFDSEKKVYQSKEFDGLDDDNKYEFLNDNIIVSVTEGKGITGYAARAYHWREDDDGNGLWYEYYINKLAGWQGTSSIQATGNDYFVVKHNDNDNMSLFEYDGSRWSVYYSNENLVHHQDFDPKTEAEWDAVPGYNFFVARKPRIKKHAYGNQIKPFREYELYERINKEWVRSATVSSGSEKHVYVGSNWFFVNPLQIGYIRDGRDWREGEPLVWREEDYSKTLDDRVTSFLSGDPEDCFSLNGDFFVEELGTKSTIYYKKRDSFRDNIGAFFVAKKYVKDPVVDKTIEVEYDYTANGAFPIYDYMTKSPFVYSYRINLPDKGGIIEKRLCYENNIALGEICGERYFISTSPIIPVKTIDKNYERYHDDKWPEYIYQDRVSSIMTTVNNIQKTEIYKYADGINDLVSRVVLYDNNNRKNISETVNIYAVEKYPHLKNENRLTEKVATYQCIPDCDGKIVSGNVATYSEFDKKWRVHELWSYTPKEKRESSFSFDWNARTHGDSWSLIKEISSYYRGAENESVDQIGVKKSVIFEKEKNNWPVATVENAGLNSILVLPGDACEVDNWAVCDTVWLTDRSLGNDYGNLNTSYSRFSKPVIRISKSHKLQGEIKEAKSKKYRFSAWVQGTSFAAEGDVIQLKLESKDDSDSDNETEFVLKGKGIWEYIEWNAPSLKNAQSYTLSLSTKNDSEIHLQDIRFVPEDALVEVSFWDKHLSKIMAKVNDRGVGSFIEYDPSGRIRETYGESALGEIVLLSKSTYVQGVCFVSSDKNHVLKNLVVNGEKIPVSTEPGVIEVAVKNNTDELDISWSTLVDGEKVFYSLHKTGEEPEYKEDCCASSSRIIKDFDGSSMTLDIAVSSLAKPYKVIINRQNSGWVDYGKFLTEGFNPVFRSDNDISAVRYLTNNGIRNAKFNGSEWNGYDKEIRYGKYIDIGGIVNNNFGYIFALPDYTGLNKDEKDIFVAKRDQNAYSYRETSSQWDNLGSFDKAGVKSDLYHMASSKNNVTYVIYNSDEFLSQYDESGTLSVSEKKSLVAKNIKGSGSYWINMGAVVDNVVEDADIAIGNNIPFVAYLGSYLSVKKLYSKKNWEYLKEHPEKDVSPDDDSNDDIDDGYIEEDYQASDVAVFVKHYDAAANKWIGYNSDNGDVLKLSDGNPLPNAKNVKLSSDGDNLYMALTYNDGLSSQYALKIYKLEYSDSDLKFVEIVDQSFNSAIIAYLGENDHFDLLVHKAIPYVSFVNAQNNGKITVLKYDENKWMPVGRPAFASVSAKKNSADLAVNANGNPYVVFREDGASENVNRRNKIVPMKYFGSDKDLTIASIGKTSEALIAKNFRRYILKYDAIVPMETEQVSFDLEFTKKDHVNGLIVKRNDNFEYSWKKDNSYSFINLPSYTGTDFPKITIPLKDISNEIKIIVYNSGDEVPLTYTFNIKRESASNLNFKTKILGRKVGSTATKDLFYVYNSSSSSSITSLNGNYNQGNEFDPYLPSNGGGTRVVEKIEHQIDPPEDGSSSKMICIEHNSLWSMIVNNILFSRPVCLEYDFEKNTFVVSSSSENAYSVNSSASTGSYSSAANSSSSVAGNVLTFIDKNGNKKIVEIVVVSSSSTNPQPYSSGNTDPYEYSSASTAHNSSASTGHNSSASTGHNSSASTGHNSSASTVLDETAIPKEYILLYDYKFVASSDLSFENSVSIHGGYYMSKNMNVAADANILGTAICSDNIVLNSNAYVKSIILGGVLSSQAGASYGSIEQKNVYVLPVEKKIFSTNGNTLNVNNGQNATLLPGKYGNVNIYANANVVLEPGVYYFSSLYVAPDVTIKSSDINKPVQIWVQNGISFGDRSRVMADMNPKYVFIYGNGTSDMYIGVQSKISATIAYPNGLVNLAPRLEFAGSIWSNMIKVGANTVVK